MELEEAIKFLEDYLDKEDRKFVSEYRLMFLESIDRLIKYIKEESIARAVVEEKIEELKILAEKSDDETLTACELDIRKNQIYLLQNILNKGE